MTRPFDINLSSLPVPCDRHLVLNLVGRNLYQCEFCGWMIEVGEGLPKPAPDEPDPEE